MSNMSYIVVLESEEVILSSFGQRDIALKHLIHSHLATLRTTVVPDNCKVICLLLTLIVAKFASNFLSFSYSSVEQ